MPIKLKMQGESGTTLGELRRIANSLERIADSLEILTNEKDSVGHHS